MRLFFSKKEHIIIYYIQYFGTKIIGFLANIIEIMRKAMVWL